MYNAATRYQSDGVPLVVLAGADYASGSSRDWAAKGTALLGIRAVLARSFERIHRFNLIGMGVLPLRFPEGCDVKSLGLTGHETFSISGLRGLAEVDLIGATVHVDGDGTTFDALARIDTPSILHHVVRQVAATESGGSLATVTGDTEEMRL